jgi:TRAP-type C4-dicarboxylate transport system substrate-binding protein
MQPRLVRWVLAHEPIEIFIRAAEKFAEVIEQRAPGQLKIEILTLSEYSKKYHSDVTEGTANRITKHQLLDLMAEDKIEMSQMYTYVLSKFNKDLNALDMPFLFRDHDHAAKVFEGPIGAELLEGYSKNNSKIKGMAFTYSGGFKNVPYNKEITSLSDLAGAKVRVSNSPVCYDTFAALGAQPVVMDVEEVTAGIRDGRIDAGESSWPRVYACQQNEVAKSILNSEHSLLLTNIIINTDFFNSLSPELQAVMQEAAVEAARFERAISVADVEPTAARAQADGIKVVSLSDADQAQFRSAVESIYAKYENYFTPGLIDSIKKQ